MSVHETIRQLPSISAVRDRCRAMAMLDAILSPEWEFRYYSFNSKWSATEELASMRDGGGAEYSIVFSPAGAFARGFDHESPMNPYRAGPSALWPGLLDSMPVTFQSSAQEPAFQDMDSILAATVCFWREPADSAWACGAVEIPQGGDDGADNLFGLLVDGRPEGYREFAESYYEVAVDLGAVAHIFSLGPLTDEIVAALNPDLGLADLAADIDEIDYPTSRVG
ncbi:hypothetical protein ACQP0C_40005 [Nocardia sp. CA-129566]|uniref:hypothetical protein n=1 Tax=Nocardia sp. CA-129566 TaxID=3239976 RepID=UPI003D98E751